MRNLQGLLESIGLMDVVQVLHMNRKTGVLRLQNGRASGVLHVCEGEVVHAESGRAVGEAAAFELMTWDRGEFEFVSGPVKPLGSIRRTVPDLLMESARTLDTRRRLRTYFPNLEAVPWTHLPEPALTAGLDLGPEARLAISLFDGYHDFRQVMAATQQNEVAVLEAAFALLEAERLQIFEPSVPLAAALLKPRLFGKADHVEVGAIHESRWRGLQPYSHGRIGQVHIQWQAGAGQEGVRFNQDLPDGTIAVPEALLRSWGLAPSDPVVVRPAR